MITDELNAPYLPPAPNLGGMPMAVPAAAPYTLPPAMPQPAVGVTPAVLESLVGAFQESLRAFKTAEHALADAKTAVLAAKQDLTEALDFLEV
jgi:hypothetical protein